MFTNICGIQKNSTGEPIFKAQIETVDVEKKHMETKAEGGMG